MAIPQAIVVLHSGANFTYRYGSDYHTGDLQ